MFFNICVCVCVFFVVFFMFFVIIITVRIQHYCLYSDSLILLPLMMRRPLAPAALGLVSAPQLQLEYCIILMLNKSVHSGSTILVQI